MRDHLCLPGLLPELRPLRMPASSSASTPGTVTLAAASAALQEHAWLPHDSLRYTAKLITFQLKIQQSMLNISKTVQVLWIGDSWQARNRDFIDSAVCGRWCGAAAASLGRPRLCNWGAALAPTAHELDQLRR